MQVLALVVQVASLFAIGAAIYGLFQNSRVHKRQSNAMIFLEYTRRYEQVMSSFPPGAFRARLDSEHALPEPSEDLSLAVLRYLNISSEEFYLWKQKYLKDEVWEIWESELKRMLRSPLLRREWSSLLCEFESYPEFVAYVWHVQSEVNAKAA